MGEVSQEINAGLAGIADFLIHRLLEQFLAEWVVEPERPGVGGVFDPVHIFGQPTEERGTVMPLGRSKDALRTGQVTKLLSLGRSLPEYMSHR